MRKIFRLLLLGLIYLIYLPLEQSSFAQSNYYSNGNDDITLTSSWWSNNNGTGSHPIDFLTDNQIFHIQYGHSMFASNTLIVSGTNSKVVIHSGGKISSGLFNHDFLLDMESGAEYEVDYTSWGKATKGNWDDNSTIRFTNNSIAFRTIDHPNVIIDFGTKSKSIGSGNTLNILGDLTIQSGTFSIAGTANTAVLNIGGSLILNSGTFSTGSAEGILNFTNNGKAQGDITINSGTLTLGTGSTTDAINIENGRIVGLNSNITINNGTILTVNGTLNCGNNIVSGDGIFTLSSGATLGIGSSDGITLTSSKGSIQTSTRNFAADGNYVYNGSSAQVTGNGIVSANNLTIQNSAGVSLTSDLSVNNLFTLSSGNLILGSKNLTFGTSASVSGTSSASNMIVTDGTGELRKMFSGIGSFTFPIGENTGTTEYSPVTLNFTSGIFSNAYAGARCVNSKHSNNTSESDYINRYWKLSQSGISSFSCDVSFQYNHSDVIGDENNLFCAHWDGTNWTLLNVVDASSNILSGTVTSFSDFSGGNSSALPVELVSFKAEVIDENVFLSWQTATEINNYGFDVERKTLTDGLNNWVTIGFANGSGNSNSPRNYFFMDKNIHSGKYSYRLKQIDNNGSFKYLKEIEVEQNKPLTFLLNQNYPNPFNPSTTISFTIPVDGQVNLILYNVIGQKIRTLINDYRKAGSYEIKFSSSELCNGTYFYKLSAGNFSEIKKMILLK